MIKHKLLTLLVALCATTALWAGAVTSTFTDNNWNVGNGEETWTASAAAYGFEPIGSARGVQVRLVDIHNNGLTLTNTSIKDLGVINKIEIVYSSNCADSSAGTISVTVGSITLGETYTIKKENNATISFESETPVIGGDIVITFTSTATSKSMYVKSISVTYSDFPENYTITYTATEKLSETTNSYTSGLHTYAFNVKITSHKFSNGVGTVTFDGEVTTIGNGAFYGCSALTSITIPNSVTTIGGWAFEYCGLTSVTIPNSVTEIGSEAFRCCYSLTSVTIPNSVTSIGYEAFYGCSGLTSVTIPNSVKTIGDEAFYGCTSLPIIDNLRYADTTYLVEAVDKTLSTYTIKEGTKWIGFGAFRECSKLTSVTIPNSVKTIGDEAFYGCSGLTSVTIGNSVTEIGKWAFRSCYSLTSVTIPNSVTSIGSEAFYGCRSLTSVTIPNSVTSIGSEAFKYCGGLKTVTLNSNAICSKNYSYNDNIGSMFIGSIFGSQVKEYIIGDSVTTIGKSAFENCDGLTSITIPNSVTSIGEYAFRGCSGLTKTNYTGTIADWCKIKFSSSASNPICYSYNFFINDVEIKDLVIPEGVETIGDYAFEWCKGLTSVTIGNSVTSIGSEAFKYCKGLTSVTIGNSVTTIGEWAFEYCSGLTSVTCEATTPPTCGYKCFYDVDKSIPLYVPAGSVKAYKAADVWRDFTDIRPITAKDVEVTEIEADPTESAVEIAWPSVVNAETYTIEIRLGDQLICSIVFNAQGQLVSINFNLAPGRGGHTYATTAEGTATGWAYTIAGLNPGTNYTYSVIAKNADGQVIDTKSGIFSTRNTPTDIDNMGNNFNNSYVNPTKSLRNGQVIIRQGDKTYNVVGQEVK